MTDLAQTPGAAKDIQDLNVPTGISVQRARPRVLLVDDDKDIRETYVDIYSEEGYEVIGCATVEEAVAALEAGTFDVAIIDSGLGENRFDETSRSGRLILEHIKPRGIPFANFTAAHISELPDAVRGSGFIDKWGSPKQFADFLREYAPLPTEE